MVSAQNVSAAFILLVLLLPGSAWAQFNKAQLAGTVQDMTGGVIPGVTVTAIHRETGSRFLQLTDARGDYVLVDLPVGDYAVTAELMGFKRMNQPSVVLEIGKTVRLDFKLEVG